jgi:hypothetical protein
MAASGGHAMRKLVFLVAFFAAATVARGQMQEMSDAMNGLAPGNMMTGAGAMGGRPMGMIMCQDRDLPYMGMYSDGVSPWWGGNVAPPAAGSCGSMMGGGMTYDVWRVPAAPGDVFDVAFAGPAGCYLALADDDSNSMPTMAQTVTAPGSGSLMGMFVGGSMGFTVPPSFHHDSMQIWVGRGAGQTTYMLGAMKLAAASLTCTPSATSMCLDGGRFLVSADWQKSSGESGHGTPVPLTADTGYFWFFGAANVEMVVKVLGACALNGHQWVFAGGLTNVAVTLNVRDTQTGALKTYQNPAGAAFVPIQDTGAFACP